VDVRHLLLIGAYRDNEVDGAHPLMHKLEAGMQAEGSSRSRSRRLPMSTSGS
jgi:hypothetical protein